MAFINQQTLAEYDTLQDAFEAIPRPRDQAYHIEAMSAGPFLEQASFVSAEDETFTLTVGVAGSSFTLDADGAPTALELSGQKITVVNAIVTGFTDHGFLVTASEDVTLLQCDVAGEGTCVYIEDVEHCYVRMSLLRSTAELPVIVTRGTSTDVWVNRCTLRNTSTTAQALIDLGTVGPATQNIHTFSNNIYRFEGLLAGSSIYKISSEDVLNALYSDYNGFSRHDVWGAARKIAIAVVDSTEYQELTDWIGAAWGGFPIAPPFVFPAGSDVNSKSVESVDALELFTDESTHNYRPVVDADVVGAADRYTTAVPPGYSLLIDSYYDLDEGAGTSATNSGDGEGLTLTLQNGASWVAGVSGTGVAFDGLTQSLSAMSVGNDPLSMRGMMLLWAKSEGNTGLATIAQYSDTVDSSSPHDGWKLQSVDDVVQFWIGTDANLLVGSALPAATYTQIIVVFNGHHTRMWVDGQYCGQLTTLVDPSNYPRGPAWNALRIGAGAQEFGSGLDDPVLPWEGAVDDLTWAMEMAPWQIATFLDTLIDIHAQPLTIPWIESNDLDNLPVGDSFAMGAYEPEDVDGPTYDNITDLGAWVPATDLAFDVHDLVSGVDLWTWSLDIKPTAGAWTPVVVNGVYQAGYEGVNSGVTALSGDLKNFTVTVDFEVELEDGDTGDLRWTFYDLAGNQSDYTDTYAVVEPDVTAPTLENQVPAHEAAGVSRTPTISFDVTDGENGTGVNLDSIDINVHYWDDAFLGVNCTGVPGTDGFGAGFAGTIEALPGDTGYTITFTSLPETLGWGANVGVAVYAEDNSSNVLDVPAYEWVFDTIADDDDPYVINNAPEGAIEDTSPTFTCRVGDESNGVATFNVYFSLNGADEELICNVSGGGLGDVLEGWNASVEPSDPETDDPHPKYVDIEFSRTAPFLAGDSVVIHIYAADQFEV